MQNQNAIPQATPCDHPLTQVCELEVSEPQLTQSFEINVNIAIIAQKYEGNGSLNHKISHRGSGAGGNLSPSFSIIIKDGMFRDIPSRKMSRMLNQKLFRHLKILCVMMEFLI